jgi:phosphohistidine phosphatase
MATLVLWLLRHAKTVTDPPKGGSDFDRVLAPRGRRDATALGLLFGRDGSGLGVEGVRLPQRALVSPAARTAATAELVLAHLAEQPEQVLLPALYAASPDDVLDVLRGQPTAVTSVMVVGHNPTAHALAQGLIIHQDKTGRDLAAKRGLPTCALGVYRFDGLASWSEVGAQSATLVDLLVPPYKPTSSDVSRRPARSH